MIHEAPSATNSTPVRIPQVLRRRTLLAVGLILVVSFGLVFPFPMEGRFWGQLFDLAHAPVFCLALIFLVAFCDPPAAGLPKRFQTILPVTIGRVVLITVVLTCVGIVGEYLQKFANRNPSWHDVAANSMGLVAGLLWVISRKRKGKFRLLFMASTILVLVAVSVHPVLEAWDCVKQMRRFPVLSTFEHPRELGSWVGNNATLKQSAQWSSHGDFSMSVEMRPAEYSGAAMIWFEADWSEFATLKFDVRNSNSKTIRLIVKVFDKQHGQTGYRTDDRFHQELTVEAKSHLPVIVDLNAVRSAPAKREMNMQQISRIEIFSVDVSEESEFLIDHVQLVK